MTPLSLRARVACWFAATLVIGFLLGRATFGQFRDGFIALTSECHYYNCTPYSQWDLIFWFVRMIGLPIGFVLLVWFGPRRALAPLRGMATVVDRLGPHNLGQRIRRGGTKDDLRVLSDAVDDLLDRMVVNFENQRRFASNASHELRTPLAVQRTLVEVAMVTGNDDPELNRLGAQLLLVNERNERLIEGLLVLAESDRGLPSTVPVRLDTLVAEVITNYEALATDHQITIRRGLVTRTTPGDPVLLERMISNLIHNAIKYNTPGGWIEVVVADHPALSIHNSGALIPPTAITTLFDPFRRLAPDRINHRDGAGLGLSIVRSIVAAHHGTVSAHPGTTGGLRIDVTLPPP
ncbi:sensor histidine kinase [Actinokineospora inagensis]|uniref:sensor histidine kinase n=1 Tax=Actinokineospora inagensis TaxID=103730 RepID=UPI0003FCDAD2|nr:ATP-binding protein [Actinokineospora inagensis]